jgi:UDP-N-acetylglucosamine 2-epimerase (non-hydrolysing)
LKDKKIMVVFGTRPEAIKMAPLIRELNESTRDLGPVVVATAQHRQLLDQVLDLFDVHPDRDLNVMTRDQSPHDVLSRCVSELGSVIGDDKPDFVLVQGDTTTTLGAALAAFYHQIPVGHVEAGLRTGQRYSPFPEEMNRRATTAIGDLHFAPTERSRQNLLGEGVPESSIVVTGNTVVDALLWVRDMVHSRTAKLDDVAETFQGDRKLVLVTGHRRENFGRRLEKVCLGLKRLAERNPEVEIVYPVHPNPNVREPVGRILSGVPNIHAVEPVGYATFVWLMERCHFIISDSGGVQEEAPSLGKPVLVTRDVTERPEAVEIGAVKVVGAEADRLVQEAETLLHDPASYEAMVPGKNPFGDSRAAERIVDAISRFLGLV